MSLPTKPKPKRIALTELPGDVHPAVRLNFHQIIQHLHKLEERLERQSPGYKVNPTSKTTR